MPTSFNLAAVCTAGSLLQNLCLEAQDESVSQTQQHKTVPRAVQASQRPVNRSPCVKSMESPVNSCYRLDYRVSLSLTSFQ